MGREVAVLPVGVPQRSPLLLMPQLPLLLPSLLLCIFLLLVLLLLLLLGVRGRKARALQGAPRLPHLCCPQHSWLVRPQGMIPVVQACPLRCGQMWMPAQQQHRMHSQDWLGCFHRP